MKGLRYQLFSTLHTLNTRSGTRSRVAHRAPRTRSHHRSLCCTTTRVGPEGVCLGHSLTFSEVTGTRGGSGGTHSHRGLLGQRTAWHPLLVHTGFPLPVSDENLRFRFYRRQPTLTLLSRIDPFARINYLYVRYYIRNYGYY